MPALIASGVIWLVITGISKFIVPLAIATGCVTLYLLFKLLFEWLSTSKKETTPFSAGELPYREISGIDHRSSMHASNICLNIPLLALTPRKGLVIDEPWISKILSGHKTWEMRSRHFSIRGPIALIRKGSRQVVGIADLVDCEGPLSNDEILINETFHRVPLAEIRNWRYALKLQNVRTLRTPVHYFHRKGAVTWVTLDEEARREIALQL